MNKKVLNYELIGFVFTCVAGTLLHFAYDWSNQSTFAALFAPVNESVWEHMKLLFFPYFAYAVYERVRLDKDKFNVFFAKYAGIVSGIAVTLGIFYLSQAIAGQNIPWVNIASFFAGVAVAYSVSCLLINSSVGSGFPNGICLALFIITAMVFFLFTFYPPIVSLFEDPQNFTYGIGRVK